MERPHLIQIGDRILNLDAVWYIDIESADLISVRLPDHKLQFEAHDARTLLAALNSGYVYKAESAKAANA